MPMESVQLRQHVLDHDAVELIFRRTNREREAFRWHSVLNELIDDFQPEPWTLVLECALERVRRRR